ncbi:hypothetical protein [Dehalogenimonas formicexedens]|nr:hypothetical protein [Dehalogenimonas formicexedens]
MLSLFVAPGIVRASTGISLTPFESIKIDVSPGSTVTHRMTLQLGTENRAMDVAVDIMGYGSSPDGSVQTITPVQDVSPYSARAFIRIDKPTFHLDPGGSQDIVATISIPSDIGSGGRYAVIYIHELPPAGGTGSLSAFNIPVLLTIKGSTLTHTATVTEVKAGKVASGQPIEISTTFRNTGNHHYKVTGEIAISNSQGLVIDTIQIPLSSSSIIPGSIRQISALYFPKITLSQGVYSINTRLVLEDGTYLVSGNGSFEVIGPYATPTSIPTTSPASTEIVPSSSPTSASKGISVTLLAGIAAGALLIVIAMFAAGNKKAAR